VECSLSDELSFNLPNVDTTTEADEFQIQQVGELRL
jgi:hypothetical protein